MGAMLAIILILLVGIYILYFILRRRNIKISEKGTQQLRNVHFILLGILLVLGLLAKENIYLRGFWTTKILIWTFIFSAFILYAFGRKEIQNKIERIYYGLFFFSPFYLLPLSFVPPYPALRIFTPIFYTIGDKRDIYYSDSNYRIQQVREPFSVSPYYLFVKRGLLEFKQKPLDFGSIEDFRHIESLYVVDSVSVTDIPKDRLKIRFYLTEKYKKFKWVKEVEAEITN